MNYNLTNATRENPRLIIDWSVLNYIAWFRMRTPGYVAQSGIEIEEYARNLAEEVLFLVERFKPVEVVFALDSPSWRGPYFAEYYKNNTDYYRDIEGKSWVYVVDGDTFTYGQNTTNGVWHTKKLSKKDTDCLNLSDPSKFIPFIGGIAPDWLIEQYPDAPKTIRDHYEWSALEVMLKKYKGSRLASKWDFETPKDEWKRLSIQIAYNFADTVGGKAVKVEWAEGDDIIAGYCTADPTIPTVIVSIDSDLKQLLIPCIGVEIFNPKTLELIAPQNREGIKFELLCKLLGGDTSDNIAGAALKGKKPFSSVDWISEGQVKNGKTTVEFVRQLMQECADSFPQAYEKLELLMEKRSWIRNNTLIHLGYIPSNLLDQIKEATKYTPPKPPKYSWSDYGVSERKELAIKSYAYNQRNAENAQ